MTTDRRRPIWPIVTAALIGLPIMCIAFLFWREYQLAVTKSNGERIAVALDEFRADRGEFPNSLDELVPKWISEIPPALWGEAQWTYFHGDETGFDLRVKRNRRTGDGNSHWLVFDTTSRGWYLGD